MVQGTRSAPLHYVIVTIYVTRAIKQEHPRVHQVWVADDGFFGSEPKEAATFLPYLRTTYAPLGLRMAKEKLEVIGLHMHQTQAMRAMITRHFDNPTQEARPAHPVAIGPVNIYSERGAIHCKDRRDGTAAVLTTLQYTEPFTLEWVVEGEKQSRTHTLPRTPRDFDTTLTELYRLANTLSWPTEHRQRKTHVTQLPAGTYVRTRQTTELFYANPDWRPDRGDMGGLIPVALSFTIEKGTLLTIRQAGSFLWMRSGIPVATKHGKGGYCERRHLAPATDCAIPTQVTGLMDMDNTLVPVEEGTITYMGASMPAKDPPRMPPKMEEKINKIIHWYGEEEDNLPITSLVIHMHSKITGTLRVQFKAALLPTGPITGAKRDREEEDQEQEGGADNSAPAGNLHGRKPPRRIKDLTALQQELNHAIAIRTGFDHVAHVNRSWLYCEPPVGLGVPHLEKEQAVCYLTELTRMNSADEQSWAPAWDSINHEFQRLQVCTHATLPVYQPLVPRNKKHTLAGNILQAAQELQVALFWNIPGCSCRTQGPILIPRPQMRPREDHGIRIIGAPAEGQPITGAWLEQWPAGAGWIPVIPVPTTTELTSTKPGAIRGHHLTDFFRLEQGRWRQMNLPQQPSLHHWLGTLTDRGTLKPAVAEHMTWAYAQRKGTLLTTQAYEAPRMPLLKQSPPGDERARLIEKIVTHASDKTEVLQVWTATGRIAVQWTADRQQWLEAQHGTLRGWMERSRQVHRDTKETWSLTPEMESILVE
eukprot:gene4914-78_t